MQTKQTKTVLTKADMKRKLKETEAQLIHNHHFASSSLPKFSESKMLGSGVVIEVTALGGKLKIDPFFLANGLSEETIKCLQADLKRSFEYMTEFKPK